MKSPHQHNAVNSDLNARHFNGPIEDRLAIRELLEGYASGRLVTVAARLDVLRVDLPQPIAGKILGGSARWSSGGLCCGWGLHAWSGRGW